MKFSLNSNLCVHRKKNKNYTLYLYTLYNSTSELPGFQHVLKSFLDVKNDSISKEILKKIPRIIPNVTIKEAFDKFSKGETMGKRMITDETLVEDDMGEGIIFDQN